MKRKITALILGDQIRYTVQKKDHWWNCWHYIYDGQYPRLFSLAELVKFHIISIEEMDKHFKSDSENIVQL